MRVLHLNISGKETSNGRIAYQIIQKSNNVDIESMLLYNVGLDSSEDILQKYEVGFPALYRKTFNKVIHKSYHHAYFSTKVLIKRIEEYAPDIIHLHVIHHGLYDFVQLFNFIKEYQVPLVITLHDCWFYTGGCYHYTEHGCNGFQTGCHNCSKARTLLDCSPGQTSRLLKYKVEFFTSYNQVYFVGVSEWICNEARKSLIGSKPIYKIYNGIDTRIFYDKRYERETKKLRSKLLQSRKYIILGVASYWTIGKRQADFVRIAKILGNEYQVILVGNVKSIESGNHAENVSYLGAIYDNSFLAQVYSASDVLVNLSVEESFGLVTAEAAACGIAVIAYSSTANIELVNMVRGRLIYEIGDINSVCREIEEICKSGYNPAGRTNVLRTTLSTNHMCNEYINLYKHIKVENGKL